MTADGDRVVPTIIEAAYQVVADEMDDGQDVKQLINSVV